MEIYFRIPFTHYWIAKFSLYQKGESYKGLGLVVKCWDDIGGKYYWKAII